MKENCEIWSDARIEAVRVGTSLAVRCPLQDICTDGCLMTMSPMKQVKRRVEVHERVRHYSDVPAYLARSTANKQILRQEEALKKHIKRDGRR